MEYKELSKLYHMDQSSSRDKSLLCELEARRSSESAFLTGFDTPFGELFFTVPNELSLLNERVLGAEREIAKLLAQLPEIARSAVLRGMVLDEVVCTNSIEAIHSTRRQVRDALGAPTDEGARPKRFRELAMLYLDIIDGSAVFPESPADVRKTYDRVTDGEIPCDKRPDGQYFRKEGVEVTAGDFRVVHRGLEPESKIIEAMEKMISLVRDDRVPKLYSAIASHYIFEYVHPFYDGNGRTGRYLLSLLVSKQLSAPTALSLSRTIAEHKGAYYRAFKTVETKLNHAELTFFIITMIDLVREAQIEVADRLRAVSASLGTIDEAMKRVNVGTDLKSKEKDIVRLFLQYEAFGLIGDASVREIAEYLGVGKQQARKYLASLEEKRICRKLSSYNPVTFKLEDAFLKRCGIEPLDNEVVG